MLYQRQLCNYNPSTYDNAPEFRVHFITQLKQMLSVKGSFTAQYRPQSIDLCEDMNQMIENIIKCTLR